MRCIKDDGALMSVFVDTNVLVYARDASEPDKQQRAQTWMAALWESRAGRTSSLRPFRMT